MKYSFGMSLICMCIEDHIIDFLNERFKAAFSKKKSPTTNKLIRTMTEGDWRPVGYDQDRIAFAPSTINDLIVRCCHPDPSERPSFAAIVEDLSTVVTREVTSVVRGGPGFSRRGAPDPTGAGGGGRFGRSSDPMKPRQSLNRRGTQLPTAMQPASLEQVQSNVRWLVAMAAEGSGATAEDRPVLHKAAASTTASSPPNDMRPTLRPVYSMLDLEATGVNYFSSMVMNGISSGLKTAGVESKENGTTI